MKLSGQRCRCPSCAAYFNSTYAFDLHRTGTYQPMQRRCLTVAEMHAKKMVRNAAGYWISHAKVDPSAPGVSLSGDRPDPFPPHLTDGGTLEDINASYQTD